MMGNPQAARPSVYHYEVAPPQQGDYAEPLRLLCGARKVPRTSEWATPAGRMEAAVKGLALEPTGVTAQLEDVTCPQCLQLLEQARTSGTSLVVLAASAAVAALTRS